MTAPSKPPRRGSGEPARSRRATLLLWLASLGLYWPLWLWRTYRALRRAPGATRISPRRAALLAVTPAVNLVWTALLSIDLPRAVRRGRPQARGDEAPDTEILTILLLAPLAAGVAVAVLLGLSPVLVVLLAGYLAWPFLLPGAIAADQALGELRPSWAGAQRRRDTIGAVVAGIAAVAAVLVAALAGSEDEQSPARATRPYTFSDVSDIAVTRKALWITNTTRGTVLKLDPRTRKPLAPPIKVGRQPIDIGANEDGVWVANYVSGTVVRIDPEANQLSGPIETGRGPFGVLVRPDAVWVSNQVERTVTRIDPKTNRRAGRAVLVGQGPRGLAVGEHSVWVAIGEGNGVSRFDPADNPRRAREIAFGRFSHDVAVANGSVWVTNPEESAVTRIDPDTNRQVGPPITVAGGPSTIEYGFGRLWVAGEAGGVTQLDPRTGKMAGRPLELRKSVSDLTIGDGAVWVLHGDGKVRRLSPRR